MNGLELGNNWRAGRALVSTYRQLGEFGDKSNLLDFDVAPGSLKSYPAFESWGEVTLRLNEIKETLDMARPDGKYLGEKIDSSLVYWISLHIKDYLPWKTYVEQTMGGITPLEVSQRKMGQQHRVVADCFRELGFAYTSEGWRQFRDSYTFDWPVIQASFHQTELKVIPIILENLSSPIYPRYRTEYVSLDEPWINWTSGDRSEFLLRINQHLSNKGRWLPGVGEYLAIHEIGVHALQASAYRKNIDARRINPGYGGLTIPGPEQWGMEGLAATIPYWIRPLLNSLTDEGRFALEHRLLQHMVCGNTQIKFNSDNPPTNEELVEETQLYLPGESEEEIVRRLVRGRDDPKYKAYFWAYWSGSHYFRHTADRLTEKDRIDLLRELYTQPMTPGQIKSWVHQKTAQNIQHIPRVS